MGEKAQPVTKDISQSTSIPGWLTDASKYAVGQGQNLPTYTPYSGQGVAGLTPNQLQAIQAASGNVGSAQATSLQSLPAWMAGANFQAPNVNAASLNGDISGLLNPYTQNVVDATNSQIDKNTAQSISGADNAAAAQHAFGGDRAALADADIRNQADMTKASTTAGLLQGGYQTALGAALAAGQGNQGAAIGSAGVRNNAAGGLSNLGTTLGNLNTSDIAGLLGTGGTQQTTNQNADTFNYGEYQNQYQSNYQQAQTLAQILGALPHNTDSTGKETTTSYTNPLMGIAGLGLGIAGLGMGGGTTLGGTLLSKIPSLFSSPTSSSNAIY